LSKKNVGAWKPAASNVLESPSSAASPWRNGGDALQYPSPSFTRTHMCSAFDKHFVIKHKLDYQQTTTFFVKVNATSSFSASISAF
jgi:hypothetical protein